MNTDEIIIEQFIHNHSKEAAQALDKFEPDHLVVFFNETPNELLLKLIPFMDSQIILEVYSLIKDETVIRLFEHMEVHHAIFSIKMMNKVLAEKILNNLSSEKSIYLRQLLKYLKNSVGSYIDPTVITLSDKLILQEVLVKVKKLKTVIDPIIFVLKPDRKLAGFIYLSDLISEDPAKEIRSIMKTKIITIPPETPVLSILNHPAWVDHYCLPVVDKNTTFLGVLRLETIRSLQISTEQSDEDHGQAVITALGELYHMGLAGLLSTATDFNIENSKE